MAYRVTAVIAVYNGAAYIRRAIESVLAQTRPVDELLVIDDGSVDETAQIVQSCGPRVRYIHQVNGGVAAARNLGIREASGEWIAFLDHDDEWLPTKIERQMAALELNPRAALCYSAYWFHTLTGGRLLHHRPLAILPQTMRLRNPFPPSVVVLEKATALQVGGFDESLKGASCEDWDLFIRVIMAREVIAVEEPLANYYEVPSSSSLNYRRMLPNTLSIVDKSLLTGLTGVSRMVWRRRIQCVLYSRAARTARELGDPAMGYMLKSLWLWPFPGTDAHRWKSLVSYLRPARVVGRPTLP